MLNVVFRESIAQDLTLETSVRFRAFTRVMKYSLESLGQYLKTRLAVDRDKPVKSEFGNNFVFVFVRY